MSLEREYIRNTFPRLPSTSQRAILHLHEEYTDPADGFIAASKEQIISSVKKQGDHRIMAVSSIEKALENLESTSTLSKRNGGFFSSFFVTSEKDKGFHYVRSYDFLSSPEFIKNSQRSLRFESFLLTQNPYNSPIHLNMEELYLNKSNEGNIKTDYFHHFGEALHHVAKLIASGRWVVTFSGRKHYRHDKESFDTCLERIKTAIREYCTRDASKKRKTRIKDKFDKHKLIFKLRQESTKVTDIYERRAPLRDLKDIAAQYGHDIDDIPMDEVKRIHQLKVKLVKKYGTLGTQLYREAVRDKYFPQRGNFSFYQDCQSGKFAEFIEDHYILPEIGVKIQELINTVEISTSSYQIDKPLFQQLEVYFSHFQETYPDQLQALFEKISEKNEGLFEYVKAHSDSIKKAFKKMRAWQKNKAAYELEQNAKLRDDKKKEDPDEKGSKETKPYDSAKVFKDFFPDTLPE